MENDSQNVIITDIKMPFFSMVMFMIKWVFAIIPAAIILAAVIAILVVGASMSGIDLSSFMHALP
ncbi:hypothetical protein THII_3336 [Thioploca ingrica]|uniref:Uncharacterized protein n=1 Tax=Thioploca ingrica TaxID=40754 RepID=A0A090AH59_9GAMM|nr:hypothetical protein THII_3336 [Thioploca ingrica]